MSTQNPGFWLRLMWAFRYFVLVLIKPEFARQVADLDQARQISESPEGREATEARQSEPVAESAASMPEQAASVPEPKEQVAEVPSAQPVLQFLGLLQQEARLIDFLQEDVTQYADADIGAAARVVHGGCRKVLQQYLELEPVRTEAEQSRITVQSGFDPAEVHLTGRVSGEGPFQGVLMHKGWKVKKIELPSMSAGHNACVLAPAEVEV